MEINASGLKLLELINDILEITQMDAGQPKANDLDFRGPIWWTPRIGAMRARGGKSRHSRSKSEIAENLPPLRGDSSRLQKALHNLLSNAVKFTEQRRMGANFGPGRRRKAVSSKCATVASAWPAVAEGAQSFSRRAIPRSPASMKVSAWG